MDGKERSDLVSRPAYLRNESDSTREDRVSSQTDFLRFGVILTYSEPVVALKIRIIDVLIT